MRRTECSGTWQTESADRRRQMLRTEKTEVEVVRVIPYRATGASLVARRIFGSVKQRKKNRLRWEDRLRVVDDPWVPRRTPKA
jgi:hypothetical protein